MIIVSRGKKTIASRILKDLEDESDEEGTFLVFYDFNTRATTVFYKNLEEIRRTLGDGERLQKSVIQCRKLRTARAIEKLAEHYKADVLLFRAEALE